MRRQMADPRCMLLVTLGYLAVLLSVPLENLSMLVWFAIYPIVASALCGIGFGSVLIKSCYVLPFIVCIGVFNPFIDREIVFYIGNIGVSKGWVTFVSIILRGLFSMQAVIILISACGFNGMCRGLERMGVPVFLTVQLQFVYRYLSVILSEALDMRRARAARGYGRKSMPVRMWGTFVGQLFLRTLARGERIHQAMLARGFSGRIPSLYRGGRWTWRDTIYMLCWCLVFALLRSVNISALFSFLMINR